jgi:SET domain-containing protein
MKVIDSPHLYIMELKPNTFLDARRKGSISRFINHSCEPNCTVEVWTVGKKLRVGIFSLKAIPAGSELTFDYRWERSLRPPTK